MKMIKKVSFGIAVIAAAMASAPVAVAAGKPGSGTKTGGSWSSKDCNSTGCFYTYCKIDSTDSIGGASYGSTGGTSCYTIFIPIYAEAPAPE